MCHAKGANLRPIMVRVKSCELEFCAAFQEKQFRMAMRLNFRLKATIFQNSSIRLVLVVVRCCLSSVG